MRRFLLPILPLMLVSVHAADTPKKNGGFFGFGAPPSDQLSSGLFPDADEGQGSLSSAATRSEEPRKGLDGIFRSKKPAKVEAVSYVIENGRRVERPASAAKPAASASIASTDPAQPATGVLQNLSAPLAVPVPAPDGTDQEKRKGFLGFGRNGGSNPNNPVVAPVPAVAPLLGAAPIPPTIQAPQPAPSLSKPAASAAKPAEVQSVEMANDVTVAPSRKAETPEFAGVKPEKSGWRPSLPFLNRKKDDARSDEPSRSGAMQAAVPVPSHDDHPTDSPSAPAETVPPATPVASNANRATPTYEIRRDPNKPSEGRKDEETSREGLLTPIAKIRPPRKEKPIDLTGAETIIADGEIVSRETPSMLASAPDSGSAGPRQPPQIVNGVKTYSSWDDVTASSSSAADKIISRIR